MTESVPTSWISERDIAFFRITQRLAADGFADDTALLTTAVSQATTSHCRSRSCSKTWWWPIPGNSWPSARSPTPSRTIAISSPCRSPRPGEPANRMTAVPDDPTARKL